MTEYEDIKKDVAEIKGDLREIMAGFNRLETARAVAEERQIETSKKIDMLTLTVSNNYTSAVEFGEFKNGVKEKLSNQNEEIERLQGWLNWILRSVIGAVILAAIAALRIKGGI